MTETEITRKIKAFGAGEVSRADLVQFLTEDVRYTKPAKDSEAPGSPAWWVDKSDAGTYTPGSYDEVKIAAANGTLPADVFNEVNGIIFKRAV